MLLTKDYIYMVNDDKLMIRMNAELDHHLAEEMRQVIDDVIDKRGVTHIVFDFTKVDFMDSAGIGLIMGRYKKVMDKGDITIVGVRESVKRILLISGLHKIVNIYELKGQAAISMSKQKKKGKCCGCCSHCHSRCGKK